MKYIITLFIIIVYYLSLSIYFVCVCVRVRACVCNTGNMIHTWKMKVCFLPCKKYCNET
jgi:hypothetical protein